MVTRDDNLFFAAGMQHYFKEHPWSNTTIGDFLRSIEIGSKKSLAEVFPHLFFVVFSNF